MKASPVPRPPIAILRRSCASASCVASAAAMTPIAISLLCMTAFLPGSRRRDQLLVGRIIPGRLSQYQSQSDAPSALIGDVDRHDLARDVECVLRHVDRAGAGK